MGRRLPEAVVKGHRTAKMGAPKGFLRTAGCQPASPGVVSLTSWQDNGLLRQPLAAGTLLDAALLLKMFPPRGGDRYAFWNIEVSTFRLLFPPSVLGSERDDNGWGFSPTIGLTLMGR